MLSGGGGGGESVCEFVMVGVGMGVYMDVGVELNVFHTPTLTPISFGNDLIN
jgi:hypothetical protein